LRNEIMISLSFLCWQGQLHYNFNCINLGDSWIFDIICDHCETKCTPTLK
jgi:hypothetical protein